MRSVDSLPTPALLLDLDVLEMNLSRMAERACTLSVALRPHVKTHKCLEVASRQRALGADGLTVSTLGEAAAFADGGFEDITWAFPLIPSRLPEVEALARRIRLGVLVDSADAVGALAAVGVPMRVWLKVDCGYHRAGVAPDSPRAFEIADAVQRSPSLDFAGVLTHAGHAYECRSPEALAVLAEEERRSVVDLAARLRGRGIDGEVSVGSTPTMSAVRDLSGVTEMRPGNYVFHDYSQTVIGSCDVRDCALTVLSTVVSCQPGARHSVVDAGALALSKDPGPTGAEPGMGRIVEHGRLRDDCRLVSLSQEHGKLDAALPLGAKVRILPNHSCLTSACFDFYDLVRGHEVVGRWPVLRAR